MAVTAWIVQQMTGRRKVMAVGSLNCIGVMIKRRYWDNIVNVVVVSAGMLYCYR